MTSTLTNLFRVHRLVGSAEIQVMLGRTRQRIDQLSRDPGFPKPVVTLISGRVWRRADIERWAIKAGYTIQPEENG